MSKQAFYFFIACVEDKEQTDMWRFRITLIDWHVRTLKNGNPMSLESISILLVPISSINFRSLPDQCIRNKRFLEEQINCDFNLVAANGVKFPCHKLFLGGYFSILCTSYC